MTFTDKYYYYKDLDKRLSQLDLQRYDFKSKKCYSCKFDAEGHRQPLYILTGIYSGFDIETTTVFAKNIVNDRPGYYSAMYIAMFSINNIVVLFRTWHDVREFFYRLPRVVGMSDNAYILTWVHNLDYENSYIKHRFNIDQSTYFGKSKQKPIKYLLENHFMFHDSFSITNSSLAKLAEMYKTKHKKAEGDLDYEIKRNSSSTLTETELGYCCNDVLVLSDFSEIMINDFLLKKGYIPDTATQMLSKDLQQNAVEYAAAFIPSRYQKIMRQYKQEDYQQRMILKSIHGKIFGFEYTQGGYLYKVEGLVDHHYFTPYDDKLRTIPVEGCCIGGEMYYDFYTWLFRGGYTKSNARYTSSDSSRPYGVQEDVEGYDYTSSYPFVQTIFNFPMSKFKEIEISKKELEKMHFEYNNDDFEKHRYIFLMTFYEIKSTDDFSLESEHKCRITGKKIIDNGRVHYADELTVCLTDCDYHLYTLYYTYKDYKILRCWIADAAPLPEYLLETIWENGLKKTELKGVEGMEVEYMLAKQKFNSSYGLCCKQPIYVEYKSGNEIQPTGYETTETINFNFSGKQTIFKHKIEEYTNEQLAQLEGECSLKTFQDATKNSILSPYWGIWTAAAARYNLLTCIKKVSEGSDWITNDTIYCDTDSLYFKNPAKHRHIIKSWNDFAAARIRARLPDKYKKLSSLGQFTNIAEEDSHGITDHFVNFKTLGAKRYIKTYISKRVSKHKHIKSLIIKNSVTVAGLPKGVLQQHCNKYNLNIYEEFRNEMDFTIEDKQIFVKLARTYHDELVKINVNGEIMTEYSSCTLYPSTFKLKVKDVYMQFINEMISNKREAEALLHGIY